MKTKAFFYLGIFLLIFLVATNSCTKDYLEKPTPPKPKVGIETDSLEASYTTTALNSVNVSYWNGADFIKVELQDLSTQHLYDEDGCLNLTGTYNGLADFNSGNTSSLKLKAAYDDEYIYILAEWEDDDADASQKAWLWDGPADPLKPDNADGWTSQRNDDNIAFAFDINGAASTLGTFATVGCAASCHSSGGLDMMAPETGKVDIWNWSLALSEPFGQAFDMTSETPTGLEYDAGQKIFERNEATPNDNRSGPAYEWDGVAQNVTQSLGNATILDPAFFLLNKTPFSGDPAAGMAVYNDHSVGGKGCIGCHGEEGKGFGDDGDGPAFNTAVFSRKFSRATLNDFASGDQHDGKAYFDRLSASEREDLVAYIRGLAGVPGYYLQAPVPGESINDIFSNSSVTLPRINPANSSYKVMFKRKLDTGNDDDTKFDPASGQSYVFGVALTDNDSKNHVGSLMEYLIFKDK